MAHVRPHRSSAGTIVADVFDRVVSEGDAARFLASEAGARQIVHLDDATVLASGVARVTEESDLGAHRFELDFEYAVGIRQLLVFIPDTYQYEVLDRLQFTALPTVDERTIAVNGWTGPSSAKFETWFEEVGSTTVRIYGLPDPPGVVLFVMPHTALPAALRNRLVVRDQGDNIALELLGSGDGVLLRSPRGRKFLLRVDDNGALVTEPR